MVLTLLVVPSLVAVQEDVFRLMRSLRRGLADRRSGVAVRLSLAATSVLLAAVVALTCRATWP